MIKAIITFLALIPTVVFAQYEMPTYTRIDNDTIKIYFKYREYGNAIIYQNSEKRQSIIYDALSNHFIFRLYKDAEVHETRFYADKCNLNKLYVYFLGNNNTGIKFDIYYDNFNGLAKHEYAKRIGD